MILNSTRIFKLASYTVWKKDLAGGNYGKRFSDALTTKVYEMLDEQNDISLGKVK